MNVYTNYPRVVRVYDNETCEVYSCTYRVSVGSLPLSTKKNLSSTRSLQQTAPPIFTHDIRVIWRHLKCPWGPGKWTPYERRRKKFSRFLFTLCDHVCLKPNNCILCSPHQQYYIYTLFSTLIQPCPKNNMILERLSCLPR